MGCSRKAMVSAVKNKDFELLKFLCENRGEGALPVAAECRNLQYVKYLFEAAPEGFEPSFLPKEDLVDMAATKGFLDMIQFFHEHEFFRFTPKAMHNAAIANYFEIVKFFSIRTEAKAAKWTRSLSAKRGGSLELSSFCVFSAPWQSPSAPSLERKKKAARCWLQSWNTLQRQRR